MRKITAAAFLLTIGIIGCKNTQEYKNTAVYDIAVSDSCEIYYSNNSCCYKCIDQVHTLNNVQLLDTKLIDMGPEDCDGCNAQFAYVFKAIKPGTDTIRIKSTTATEDCQATGDTIGTYIIRVK